MTQVPLAQTLVLRNRRVRVWEMVLKPGEMYPMHQHRRPYLSIILEGAVLDLRDGSGRTERLKARDGDVFWRPRPERHAVQNVGRTEFRNRLVEILC